MSYNLFLVDDHAIVREGLTMILEANPKFKIIGQAGSYLEAIRLLNNLPKIDLFLLDISLSGEKTGIDLGKEIRTKRKDAKILFLSRHDKSEYIAEAKKLGSYGYVLKDEAGKDLVEACKFAIEGKYYLSPRLLNQKTQLKEKIEVRSEDSDQKLELLSELTTREKEILNWIGLGKSNLEIANALKISVKTVKIHRQNIMDKLSIHKSTDLVIFALKNS